MTAEHQASGRPMGRWRGRSLRMVATAVATTTALAAGAAAVGALGPRLPNPIPALIPQGDVTIGLEQVASGFVSPVGATYAPGDKETLYVVEQTGKIWTVSLDDEDDDAYEQPGQQEVQLRRRSCSPTSVPWSGPWAVSASTTTSGVCSA